MVKKSFKNFKRIKLQRLNKSKDSLIKVYLAFFGWRWVNVIVLRILVLVLVYLVEFSDEILYRGWAVMGALGGVLGGSLARGFWKVASS